MSYIYNLGLKFKEISCKYSEKAAIKFCDGSSISFYGLDRLSDKIANLLIIKGLKKNQVVAIQNEKTPFGYAAMLACIKIGVIYTNFDPNNPKERLNKIFECAKPSIVISDKKLSGQVAEICSEKSIEIFDYSHTYARSEIEQQNEILSDEILKGVIGFDPVYIMFTSGSTGIPKGVLIKQESVLNFIEWGKITYNITPDDTLTNVNPIYFDNSVFDFYCSIFNGASLAAFPKEIIEKPKEMLEIIDKTGCTFWFSVPSFLIYLNNIKLLSKETFKNIRAFSFGGEGYPKDLLLKFYNLYKERAEFFNVYGPTEGTCICSAYKVSESDFENMTGLVTLGYIAPNFDYLILDDNNVPSNKGELCLLGSQLASGYYNDKERTNKSFVNNPLNTCFEQRMYKTGDLVELKNDGKLYFIGRADNQIKHMGYRIELEEIEAGLIKILYIKQCAVVHGKTNNGFSRIVAYIATDEKIDQKQLRDDLKKFLPDYMIPNLFELMDELPKNANGKVDRVFLKQKSGLI